MSDCDCTGLVSLATKGHARGKRKEPALLSFGGIKFWRCSTVRADRQEDMQLVPRITNQATPPIIRAPIGTTNDNRCIQGR